MLFASLPLLAFRDTYQLNVPIGKKSAPEAGNQLDACWVKAHMTMEQEEVMMTTRAMGIP